jgi:ribosomal 50S subunit-recycling heat shock protein
MRLDLFLKTSRLVPRRTIARQLCDAGRIHVNGVAAKASRDVSVGDEIRLNRGSRETTVRIQKVPSSKQVSREEASLLIEKLSEENSLGEDDYWLYCPLNVEESSV